MKGTFVALDEIQLEPQGEAKSEALKMELIAQLHSIPTGQGLVLELEDGETIRSLKMRITSAKNAAGDLDDIVAAVDKEGNLAVYHKAPRQTSKRRKDREAEEMAVA